MQGRYRHSAPLTLAACFSAAAAAYSLTLLLAAGRRRQAPATSGRPRLAALVPAHDEAASIAATVASLRAVEYPAEAWRVVVVADNCSDDTAGIARAAGAEVIVREDRRGRGKGHALAHGMHLLLAENDRPEAIVVVDADCAVSVNLASAIAAELQQGARAVQVDDTVSNPCASRYSALRFAAFSAINSVRPRGRVRLGLSAGLLGTGMAFSSDLLTKRPWEAFGLAEDAEYHLSLLAGGERVAFAGEASVTSPMPTSFDAATSQQARWEGGRIALVRRWLPRLGVAAVRRRDLACAAAAWELLLPPLSVLVAATGAVTLAAAAARARTAAGIGLLALAGHAAYVLGSLRVVRAPACVYRALLAAPLLALWQLRLLAGIGRRGGGEDWVRTERQTDARVAP